ncbi:hypothetical protein TVAG_440410 [Trichomonas vaginalis G3]|uniref:Uncharacterized protein n=1 Tax=Trichomonas vaginalis (strain ATCC PRA-98 / G3) TaxID=412133 RepID=A2F1J7_TRIV3|nr:hypothetical protein TVAGG3_0369430 [Trichomonas vaginalis G3]EAY01215.1 hypothetical protein TVAG_440410 [Trichomonas vaginalis G3]KAI5532505.1 hypothetical protein TVAGG3_0369430 [Trichomonas vaginalis G3]|eukprot:XP_001330131.1 hypothetical protein [Trichomonas vaginalis G3]
MELYNKDPSYVKLFQNLNIKGVSNNRAKQFLEIFSNSMAISKDSNLRILWELLKPRLDIERRKNTSISYNKQFKQDPSKIKSEEEDEEKNLSPGGVFSSPFGFPMEASWPFRR